MFVDRRYVTCLDKEITKFLNISYPNWQRSFIYNGFEFDFKKLQHIEGFPCDIEKKKELGENKKLQKWETSSMAEMTEYVVSYMLNEMFCDHEGPCILLSGFVENWLGRLLPFNKDSSEVTILNRNLYSKYKIL